MFDCKKVTEKTISRAPKLVLQGSFDGIENIKRDNNIKRVEGVAYPVILIIINHFSYDVNFDFKATASLKDYNGNTYDLEFEQSVPVPKNRSMEVIMFDNSGFFESRLQLGSVDFQNNTQSTKPNYFSNSPFLINMDEMTNPYNGFQNSDELEEYFLLSNYLHHSGFSARGLLLQLMFENLKKINSNSVFQIAGKRIHLIEHDSNYLRCVIQMDIISKMMTYVEDLIIIIISMLEPNKNYYHLLDEKNPDVGNRITEFFDNLNELSESQLLTILSYNYPDNSEFDSSEAALVKRVIYKKIEEFRRNLKVILEFRNAHIQPFRRYKHAGLPCVFGARLQQQLGYEKSDFGTIVSVGKDPLRDVFPLPYSYNIIQRYKKIIEILQQMIIPVIKNRVDSIERNTTGIIHKIPEQLSDNESVIFNELVEKFHINNPMRCQDHDFYFASKAEKEKIKWYFGSDLSTYSDAQKFAGN